MTRLLPYRLAEVLLAEVLGFGGQRPPEVTEQLQQALEHIEALPERKERPDLVDYATAYFHEFTSRRSLPDGNRAFGYAALRALLRLNGFDLNLPWQDVVHFANDVQTYDIKPKEVEQMVRVGLVLLQD